MSRAVLPQPSLNEGYFEHLFVVHWAMTKVAIFPEADEPGEVLAGQGAELVARNQGHINLAVDSEQLQVVS